MRVNNCYRVVLENGISIRVVQPESEEYTIVYRVIADEGKKVTKNGVDLFDVLDVENAEGWYEVDAPPEVVVEEPEINPEEGTP